MFSELFHSDDRHRIVDRDKRILNARINLSLITLYYHNRSCVAPEGCRVIKRGVIHSNVYSSFSSRLFDEISDMGISPERAETSRCNVVMYASTFDHTSKTFVSSITA